MATTGTKLANIPFGDGVHSLAFSHDGRLALIGSFDKTARLVDLGKYFDLGRIAAYYRARLAQILNYNITQHIGPQPNPPVIAPCGEEERETQYRRRVTAETGGYNAKLEEYAAKQATFPAWRRNQIVEYAFYSVFGEPIVKDVRHDSTDGHTVVVIGSNSALAGGFDRNLLLKDSVLQENADAMKDILKKGVSNIRVSFENGTLTFADGFIKAAGRSYEGEFINDEKSIVVFRAVEETQEVESAEKPAGKKY